MKRLFWLVVPAFALVLGAAALAHGKAASKTATGVVKSVAADSIVVTVETKDMTFAITPATKFLGKGLGTKTKEKGGKITAADAVAAGDRVAVTYADAGGTMQASEVRITQKGTVRPK